MGFRLVPKSVTLNDLEPSSSHYCVISQNSVAFGADYVKVVEDRPIFPSKKCSSKNPIFCDITMAIFANITENKCIVVSEVIYCGSQLLISLFVSQYSDNAV